MFNEAPEVVERLRQALPIRAEITVSESCRRRGSRRAIHVRSRGSPMRGQFATDVQGGLRCQVAMHRSPPAITVHKRCAGPAAAESGSVVGGASAARTGPQRSRRSNPAARHIQGTRARGIRCGRLVCAGVRTIGEFEAFATAPLCDKRRGTRRGRDDGAHVRRGRCRGERQDPGRLARPPNR